MNPIDVYCPNCQAKPGDPCTSPTSTGRNQIKTFHVSRESSAANQTDPPQEPTTVQYANFGRYVAALLGSQEDWDGAADYLDEIDQVARRKLSASLGSADGPIRSMWQKIADQYGIEYGGNEGKKQ